MTEVKPIRNLLLIVLFLALFDQTGQARELSFTEYRLYSEIAFDLGLDYSTNFVRRRYEAERGRDSFPTQKIDDKFATWVHGGQHKPYYTAAEKWHNKTSDDLKKIYVLGALTAPLFKPSGHRLGAFMTIQHATRMWFFMNRLAKLTVERERPKYHYTKAKEFSDTKSFPSGHTGETFVAAFATTMVMDMPRWANVAILAGASSVALMRIAADKHYFTDVAVGAGIAYLGAWGAFTLFERSWGENVEFEAKPNEVSVTFRF